MKIIELTVSWETNMDAAYDRKSTWYEPLVKQCEEEGWITERLPMSVYRLWLCWLQITCSVIKLRQQQPTEEQAHERSAKSC